MRIKRTHCPSSGHSQGQNLHWDCPSLSLCTSDASHVVFRLERLVLDLLGNTINIIVIVIIKRA